MRTADQVIHARWIVPVRPDNLVLEDHALVLAGGRIVAVVPQTDARANSAPAETLNLGNHVLIPGLVNAHTHSAMSLLRGLADDLPLMEWLNDHIWPTEGRWVGEDFVRDGTRLAIAEMLRGGITCFNDMYFFPDVTAEVAREAGMRACIGLIAIDFPSAWAKDFDQYLSKGLRLHEHLAGEPLIRTMLAPHAPYTMSDGPFERVRSLSEELDLRIHIHVHETAAEVEKGLEEHGCRPLARLDRLGLVGPRLTAVHMTQLEGGEIDRLADAGVTVVHCPESNLKLASGICPVHRLSASGVGLALGTDGAASNNDLDLLGEMRTAALLAKGCSGDATAMPAHEALHMATMGGAQALGMDHEIGSLEVGKAADIVAIDLSSPEASPIYNPLSQLVYATGRNQVSDVWIAGRRVLSSHRLTTIDADQISNAAHDWGRRIGAMDGRNDA